LPLNTRGIDDDVSFIMKIIFATEPIKYPLTGGYLIGSVAKIIFIINDTSSSIPLVFKGKNTRGILPMHGGNNMIIMLFHAVWLICVKA
jgi:hypothetical protein